MKPIYLTAIATLLACGSMPMLRAQESEKPPAGKVKLAARMQTGGTYKLEQSVKTTMDGGKQDHSATQDYTLTVTPHGGAGGDKLVRSRVDRVRVETNATGDGARIAYDSADSKKQHPSLAQMGKGMLAITTAAIYGEDEVFKSFEGNASDEGSRNMMQKLTDLGFPDKPVGPGDSWKHKIETDMGQLGRVTYDLDYKFTKMATLDGAKCAQLAISGSMATVPGVAANEGFDLKSRKLSGTMFFDPELGAVRKFEIKSELDLTAYGTKMPASLVIRTVLKKFSK
ncbi:MAG: hypothetical protein ACR2RV_04015 [Verrucomicrobiales bacterium]